MRLILSNMSGMNLRKYSAGSDLPAASSKDTVLTTHTMTKAGWSRVTTFAKLYDKKIGQESDTFQEAILPY